MNFGNLSPVISGGIQLNTFATSKRTITEELYYPLDGLVLSNYMDEFPKPDPFFGASLGGGLEYWNRNNSFLLSYRFTIFQDNSFGAENCHSVSVMIKRSF